MAGSTQEKLDRVRKPRVHIKYEVETEGATVEKELPFVVGVMGDFSGELRDLMSKADRSDDLEQLLEKVLADEDAVKKLHEEIKKRGGEG